MDSKQRYRRLRSQWGWGLLVAWIGYWVFVYPDGSLGSGAYSMLALLLSPFAFAVAHVIARTVVDREENEQTEAQAREQVRLAAARQKAEEERANAAIKDDQTTRHSISRESLIRNLGTADDALRHVLEQAEPGGEALLRIDAINALRDVVARHPERELVLLLGSDRPLQVSMGAVIRKLDQARLGDSAEAMILKRALIDAYNARS